MNVDDPPKYTSQPTNAVAGPSTIPDLYLPPPGPPQPRPHLTSTQDLVSRFKLLPAYDKYVTPYVVPLGSAAGLPLDASSATDKGKGKDKEVPSLDVPLSSPAQTPAAGNDGEEEDGPKGEKMWKTYKHLIKGIAGRHSMKKDDYLTTMMQVPPKQRIKIAPFDLKTQREAFSVSLEGLKGLQLTLQQWNITALVAESPQAREDRKKRKELKRLAKAQGQALIAAGGTPSVYSSTPAAMVAATPGGPPRTATPKPAISRPGVLQQQPARGRTPVGIGTPRSIATPGGASAASPASHQSPTPMATPVHSGVDPATVKRGQKREREYSADGVQMQAPAHEGVKPALMRGAKAGSAGIRPRPVKKQRMDMNGQAREIPMQQPTPHA
ncbi:hypothetical protein A0H81_07432 [Grifola frondosa]|uniref:Mediator of RNA polymerase II transcription subunit 19 n=1 Tax=Grifola frondosa TaxID=5627 RepID=A0A1C7M7N9_GRIFR|nr:hypothetical protein A0H81_07432 [Grifola frondosa]